MRTMARIGVWISLSVLGMFWPGTPAAGAAPNPGAVVSAWSANGASACKKFLTRDFLAAILIHADGENQAKDERSCMFSNDYSGGTNILTIGLSDHVTQADWNKVGLFPGAIPVAGVGDQAVRTKDGTTLHAYTNGGRMCVSLIPLGEMPKLAGDALAKKFGTICSQLFALP